eukprot:644478_1
MLSLTTKIKPFICIVLILSIASYICSCTFTTGATKLLQPNQEMAIGYDAQNDTVLLFGGNDRRQLTAFKDPIFTLISDDFLTNEQMTYGTSQYYIQLDHVLWTITTSGDGFNKIDLNTYTVTQPNHIIPNGLPNGQCLTAIDDYLIVIGGDDQSDSFTAVQILRISDGQWLPNVPSLTTPRSMLSCVVVNHTAYAISGWDWGDSVGLNTTERLDVSDMSSISTQNWTLLPGGLEARDGSRAVVVGTDIWVFGGWDWDMNELAEVNVIDTLTGSCSVVDTLSYETSYTSAILVRNRLFVFGGCNLNGFGECEGDDRYQYISFPTPQPTAQPSRTPTQHPSQNPSFPTAQPSHTPTEHPSNNPSQTPTEQPSHNPSQNPLWSSNPTTDPTTADPTDSPSRTPTEQPSVNPSQNPTQHPSNNPSRTPTNHPITAIPSKHPTTANPTDYPPTANPTDYPPTANPSFTPTTETISPSQPPTSSPNTVSPTMDTTSSPPSANPSFTPTIHTISPSQPPTSSPNTVSPTMDTTSSPPSANPSFTPTIHTISPSQPPTSSPINTASPTMDTATTTNTVFLSESTRTKHEAHVPDATHTTPSRIDIFDDLPSSGGFLDGKTMVMMVAGGGGGVCILCVLLFVVILCYRKRQTKKDGDPEEQKAPGEDESHEQSLEPPVMEQPEGNHHLQNKKPLQAISSFSSVNHLDDINNIEPGSSRNDFNALMGTPGGDYNLLPVGAQENANAASFEDRVRSESPGLSGMALPMSGISSVMSDEAVLQGINRTAAFGGGGEVALPMHSVRTDDGGPTSSPNTVSPTMDTTSSPPEDADIVQAINGATLGAPKEAKEDDDDLDVLAAVNATPGSGISIPVMAYDMEHEIKQHMEDVKDMLNAYEGNEPNEDGLEMADLAGIMRDDDAARPQALMTAGGGGMYKMDEDIARPQALDTAGGGMAGGTAGHSGENEEGTGQESMKINIEGGNEDYALDSEGAKEVREWLESIGYGMYSDVFIRNAFDSMDLIKEIDQIDDLNGIGISLRAHQLKIVNAIRKLKK